MGAGLPSDTAKSGTTDARQDPAPFSHPLLAPPWQASQPGAGARPPALSWLTAALLGRAPPQCWHTSELRLPTGYHLPACSSLGSKPLTILGLHHSPLLPSDPGPSSLASCLLPLEKKLRPLGSHSLHQILPPYRVRFRLAPPPTPPPLLSY